MKYKKKLVQISNKKASSPSDWS